MPRKEFIELGRSQLAPAQINQAQEWMTILGISGPLVGGVVPRDDQSSFKEYRPLVIHGARTLLIRKVSFPELYRHLVDEYWEKIQSFGGESAYVHVKRISEQPELCYLITRIFYPEDARLSPKHSEYRTFPADAVRAIEKYRVANTFHGHIAPSNVYYHQNRWVLLDAGLSYLETRTPVAEEDYSIMRELGFQDDLCDLGAYLYAHMKELQLRSYATLFERMQLFVDSERADFEEVKEVLLNAKPEEEKSSFSFDFSQLTSYLSAFRDLPQLRSIHLHSPFLLIGAVTIGVLCTLWFLGIGWFRYPSPEEFRADWISRDRNKMIPVGLAAITDRTSSSRDVIIEELRKGYAKEVLFAEPLLIGFEEPWASQITRNGRRSLFTYSLAPLLSKHIESVPELSGLEPAVLFALTAGLPAGKASDKIAQELVGRIDELPSPFKDILKAFIQISPPGSVDGLSSLCRLLMNRYTSESISGYLPRGLSYEDYLRRLIIVGPTLDEQKAEALWIGSVQHGYPGDELGIWFAQNPVAKWQGVSLGVRLLATLGYFDKVALQLEQYVDLLKSPVASTGVAVLPIINDRFFRDVRFLPMLKVLKIDEGLTRPQMVSIVSAVSHDGDIAHAFIEKWFATQPSPRSVLLVLLARVAYDPGDPFSISAARYLRQERDWTASTQELQLMAAHPEPLARGLAYARLDPRTEEGERILRVRLAVEEVESLKNIIVLKLAPSEE